MMNPNEEAGVECWLHRRHSRFVRYNAEKGFFTLDCGCRHYVAEVLPERRADFLGTVIAAMFVLAGFATFIFLLAAIGWPR